MQVPRRLPPVMVELAQNSVNRHLAVSIGADEIPVPRGPFGMPDRQVLLRFSRDGQTTFRTGAGTVRESFRCALANANGFSYKCRRARGFSLVRRFHGAAEGAENGWCMRTLRCQIEDIAKWHPWFYLEPHIVASAAVLERFGDSPAVFDVECSHIKSAWVGNARRFRLQVAWSDETGKKAKRLRATIQRKPLLEMAATAVAMVLSHRVLALGQLDVTRYGERTDFRSTAVSCMLEIS